MRKGSLRVEIPRHSGDIMPGTVGSIIIKAGWTESRFWALLERRGRSRRPHRN